jgi:hypothetical protein
MYCSCGRGPPPPVWIPAHRALDAAVAHAYGWPTALSDDDILSKLLALNLSRARSSVEPISN